MAKRKNLSELVPTNWLDPLLTGPDAALKGSGPWGCTDIARLLLAVQKRIALHEQRRGDGRD